MSSKGTPGTAHRRWLIAALRAGVLATAAVVLCWPLTNTAGLVAAALGAVSGAVLGEPLGRSRLRTGSALLLSLVFLLLGSQLARAWVSWSWIVAALGPVTALHLGETTLWWVVVATVVFVIRFAAVRRPSMAILEVVAVAGATAAGFAAHRDGMVHRPLAVGDWAWSRGFDPALIFLLLGGLGTLLLAGLLIQEGRARRLPLHFGGLILVAALLMTFVRFEGLPKPDPAGDLGLTGEPEQGEGGEGSSESDQQQDQGENGGQGQHDLGDLEFKDDYGDSGEQAPIAVVLLHDDYSPPPGVYYFRQSAFSQYNGRRLVQSTRDDVDADIVRRFPFQRIEVAEAPPARGGRKALATTVGLMVEHVRPFALDAPALLEPSPNPNPMRFQRTFKVRSHVQVIPYPDLLGRLPGNVSWTAEQWRHYTEAPSDPRYGELASALVAALKAEHRNDPLAQALTIKSYLDANGIYSRRSRHADTEDPAASFLFGDLTGYCVHFAHAAAYLFRSQGIPARVAAGYAVSESDRGGGSAVLIRGGNAHAWPEIYLEGIGWVVVDLTPEQSLDEAQPAPDPRLQQILGEMMRQQSEEDPLSDLAHEPFDWRELGRRALGLLVALLALAYGIKAYRLWVPKLVSEAKLPRVGYRATLDRLSEVGLRRRMGESREAFARRAGRLSEGMIPLTDLHLAEAFGSRDAAQRLPSLAEEVRRMSDEVARQIRIQVPGWRRWLGRLDPLSWLWVK